MRDGKPMGRRVLNLVWLLLSVVAAVIVASAIEGQFESFSLRITGLAFAVRTGGCLVGTLLASFLWSRRSTLLFLGPVAIYLFLDSRSVIGRKIVDGYPYDQYLSFNSLKVVWVIHMLIATALGGFCGYSIAQAVRGFFLIGEDSRESQQNRPDR